MRVLLAWPPSNSAVLSDELSCCEPLPLEYLAGALGEDHEVRIYDGRLDGGLASFCERFEPQFVGVAVPYTSALRSSRALAVEARELWPSTTIVLGGHHVTMSRAWLENFPADYLYVGEAFMNFKLLIETLERQGDLTDVPSLVPFGLRHDLNPKIVPPDFDLDITPNRKLLARHHSSYFHSIYHPVTLMRFSAGCPFNCEFCSLWKLTDRRYLTKHVDKVIAELSGIESENVYVVDDEAFIQSDRMVAISGELKRSGLKKKFHMYLRADTAVRNGALLKSWADVGLDSVLVGIESMLEADLDQYNKRASVSDNVEAMKIFHDNGIKVRANFIIRPDFDYEDFQRVDETVRLLSIDMPSVSVLTPLPGTDLFNRVHSNLISNNPDLYDCYHSLLPTKLPLEEFYDCLGSLVASLSVRTGCDGDPKNAETPMFYYSTDDSFSKMVASIRNGAALHDRAY